VREFKVEIPNPQYTVETEVGLLPDSILEKCRPALVKYYL